MFMTIHRTLLGCFENRRQASKLDDQRVVDLAGLNLYRGTLLELAPTCWLLVRA